jgi:RNA polymerase sigma-70 factor (ECF subfamily)
MGIFRQQNRSRQSEDDRHSEEPFQLIGMSRAREHMTAQSSTTSQAELKPVSEAHLVALAQGGDESAFRALFEAHKGRVYSICLRMTHSPADAEDLTQQAFLLVFRKIATFRAESSFSTWLYRLAVNEVLMHLRKKRHPEISFDDGDASQEKPLTREYAEDDLRLTGTADRLTLNKAIAELARGYRVVFLLHDVEGYEHNEIARMMNWSVGNSKSQLHKARRKLREWFRLHQEKQPPAKPNGAKTRGPEDCALVHGMNRLQSAF